jgi:hypothetical protein
MDRILKPAIDAIVDVFQTVWDSAMPVIEHPKLEIDNEKVCVCFETDVQEYACDRVRKND